MGKSYSQLYTEKPAATLTGTEKLAVDQDVHTKGTTIQAIVDLVLSQVETVVGPQGSAGPNEISSSTTVTGLTGVLKVVAGKAAGSATATDIGAASAAHTHAESDVTGLTNDLAMKMTNPMIASGDIIFGGTSGASERLAKGNDGQHLVLVNGFPVWADDVDTKAKRYDRSGNYAYCGTAKVGSDDAAAVWTVYRLDLSVATILRTSAAGAWSNRANLTYL